MYFADLVLLTSVEKHTLGNRGLTGVDVGDDPEVTGILEGVFAGHRFDDSKKEIQKDLMNKSYLAKWAKARFDSAMR